MQCKRAAIVAMFTVLLAGYVPAQTIALNYKVMYSGKEIGWIKLQKSDSAGISILTFSSEAKKRMIIKYEVKEHQSATFQNGVLIQSSVYRKVNNDVKIDKCTVNKGAYYQVNKREFSEKVVINGIQYNQLSMYFKEPENIKQVYSDNFQCLLYIENLGNHCYKIKLPGGGANYYYYTNGQCSKVRAEHSLISVEFILSK